MSTTGDRPTGPDFRAGIPASSLADGAMVQGYVGDEAVLLVRTGEEVFAVAAFCTHYGAPLAGGLLVGKTIRCPWHHACFALHDGSVHRAPARDALKRWKVDQSDGLVRVGEAITAEAVHPLAESPEIPRSIVIVATSDEPALLEPSLASAAPPRMPPAPELVCDTLAGAK